MTFFNQTYRTVLLMSFGLSTGCDQQLTTEQENQKQQLINDSLQNMVFIEGGTFLMGDFGSGHDGKSTLPYSLGTDNKFVHDVTLDSFSLSKYRVTWGQFNLWRALTGLPIDLPTEAQWEYAARNRGQFILFASKDGTYNDGSEGGSSYSPQILHL